MTEAIVTEDLTKVYHIASESRRGRLGWVRDKVRPAKVPILALDRVNLSVKAGELFGLLGPNGAGKTTLIKILCTLLLPTGGTAKVMGFDVVKQADEVRKRVGIVLGGERSLYWRLTARENLWYFSQLYNIPGRTAKRKVEELLALVGLSERADDRVENYSKGMKQRLHIARGLINDPEVLLLDEPTLGLDPTAAREVRRLVRQVCKEKGVTVLLTTHYMYEADELSDRIAIIDRGRIIALGRSEELKTKLGKRQAVLVSVKDVSQGFIEALKGLEGVYEVVEERHDPISNTTTYRVLCKDGEKTTPLIAEAVAGGKGRLLSLSVEVPSLEDVFIELTGRSIAVDTRVMPRGTAG